MIIMGTDEGKQWLSYAEAARRVKSSGRTVRTWRRQGMPMSWRVDETGQRYRVVELRVLLAWWREKMQASPVHYYRIRAAAIARGEEPPPIPARLKQPRAPRNVDRTRDSDAELAEVVSAPRIDPLADMKPLRGGADFHALTEKLKDATPGCAGIAEFTADRVDDETAAIMADICAHCPMLARCEAFATASRPTAGFWAGRTWQNYDRPHELRTEVAVDLPAPARAS